MTPTINRLASQLAKDQMDRLAYERNPHCLTDEHMANCQQCAYEWDLARKD